MASGHTDITDYNYFDVEDFSVDSFFRSLELQSRFAPSDLEFSFPADLENVPISSCLTSVGFLDSTAAKSTEVAVVEDGHECCSNEAETSITEDNEEDDNATAVVNFFRSLELQLRSCLLRADDETVHDSPCGSRDKTDASNNLLSNSQQTAASDVSNVEQKTNRTPSRNETDSNVHNGSQSGVFLPEKSTELVYLSSAWTCASESHCGIEQTSTVVPQSETVAVLTTSTCTPHVAAKSSVSAECSELCKPTSATDLNSHCEVDPLCRKEQRLTATLKEGDAESQRRESKGGKIRCEVCDVELSSKYSYVRHLLTPLHHRRAEGYCITRPPEATTNTNVTEDVKHLISRQKPVQCRVCRFCADASPQLLQHLTSTSHYSQVKRKLLQCVPCRFVGTCDDIVTHVKSESHATLVKKLSRPSIITAYRSRRHDTQITRARTKDGRCCSNCGFKFPSLSSLEIHIRRRHTGQRPFSCSVCSKSYCDNSTLRLHYRTAQHRLKCAQGLQTSMLT